MAPLVLTSLVDVLRCLSLVPIAWQATDQQKVAEDSFSDEK